MSAVTITNRLLGWLWPRSGAEKKCNSERSKRRARRESLRIETLEDRSVFAAPPVLFHVSASLKEIDWKTPIQVTNWTTKEATATPSWSKRIDLNMTNSKGDIDGFAKVSIASSDGTIDIRQKASHSYEHHGGWPFLITRTESQVAVNTYVLGPAGTPFTYEAQATATSNNAGIGPRWDVIGWSNPGWHFKWNVTGGTYSVTAKSSSQTIIHDGQVYSLAIPSPTSTVSTWYGNSGPGKKPYKVSGKVDANLKITVTNLSVEKANPYDIQIQYGGFSPSQRALFEQAAKRWEQIIVGDLPNKKYKGQIVDDLLIHATAKPIDGFGDPKNGNILGAGKPDEFREGTNLPYHGVIEFDTADLAKLEKDGTLLREFIHEIGHVLGFGHIWSGGEGKKALIEGAGTSGSKFVGPQALAQYNKIFGVTATGVPLETSGGEGTQDAHWSESLFGNEVMTGYAGPEKATPISIITVGSLADIGYKVNCAAADQYTPPTWFWPFARGLGPESERNLRTLAAYAPAGESALTNNKPLRQTLERTFDSVLSDWV